MDHGENQNRRRREDSSSPIEEDCELQRPAKRMRMTATSESNDGLGGALPSQQQQQQQQQQEGAFHIGQPLHQANNGSAGGRQRHCNHDRNNNGNGAVPLPVPPPPAVHQQHRINDQAHGNSVQAPGAAALAIGGNGNSRNGNPTHEPVQQQQIAGRIDDSEHRREEGQQLPKAAAAAGGGENSSSSSSSNIDDNNTSDVEGSKPVQQQSNHHPERVAVRTDENADLRIDPKVQQEQKAFATAPVDGSKKISGSSSSSSSSNSASTVEETSLSDRNGRNDDQNRANPPRRPFQLPPPLADHHHHHHHQSNPQQDALAVDGSVELPQDLPSGNLQATDSQALPAKMRDGIEQLRRWWLGRQARRNGMEVDEGQDDELDVRATCFDVAVGVHFNEEHVKLWLNHVRAVLCLKDSRDYGSLARTVEKAMPFLKVQAVEITNLLDYGKPLDKDGNFRDMLSNLLLILSVLALTQQDDGEDELRREQFRELLRKYLLPEDVTPEQCMQLLQELLGVVRGKGHDNAVVRDIVTSVCIDVVFGEIAPEVVASSNGQSAQQQQQQNSTKGVSSQWGIDPSTFADALSVKAGQHPLQGDEGPPGALNQGLHANDGHPSNLCHSDGANDSSGTPWAGKQVVGAPPGPNHKSINSSASASTSPSAFDNEGSIPTSSNSTHLMPPPQQAVPSQQQQVADSMAAGSDTSHPPEESLGGDTSAEKCRQIENLVWPLLQRFRERRQSGNCNDQLANAKPKDNFLKEPELASGDQRIDDFIDVLELVSKEIPSADIMTTKQTQKALKDRREQLPDSSEYGNLGEMVQETIQLLEQNKSNPPTEDVLKTFIQSNIKENQRREMLSDHLFVVAILVFWKRNYNRDLKMRFGIYLMDLVSVLAPGRLEKLCQALGYSKSDVWKIQQANSRKATGEQVKGAKAVAKKLIAKRILGDDSLSIVAEIHDELKTTAYKPLLMYCATDAFDSTKAPFDKVVDFFVSSESSDPLLPVSEKGNVDGHGLIDKDTISRDDFQEFWGIANESLSKLENGAPVRKFLHQLVSQAQNNRDEFKKGLSVDDQGYYRFYKHIKNSEDCPMEVREYLEKYLQTDPRREEWEKDRGDPRTEIEREKAGCKYFLDDLELLQFLGGGSFGKAFLARLVKNPSFVVVLKFELCDDRDFFVYKYREVVAGTKESNANLARLLGYFRAPLVGNKNTPLCVVMIMEPCGRTLQQMIPDLQQLSKTELVCALAWILMDLLSGTCPLEKIGLAHRDIKLENVCLAPDGHFKLIDFGLARLVLDENNTARTGTDIYIPPEASGKKLDTAPAKKHDPFSLGVLAYICATGDDKPWQKNSIGKKLSEIKKSELKKTLLAGTEDGMFILSLIEWLMAPNPKERCTVANVWSKWKMVYETLSQLPEFEKVRSILMG